MKTCSKCKEVKEFIDFPKDKTTKSGFYPSCKKCVLARPYRIDQQRKRWYDVEYRKANQVRKIKNTYAVSMEEATELYRQSFLTCEICHKQETSLSSNGKGDPLKRLAIDHCHETGVVRGVLCMRCNKGMGLFKDSISILFNAIKYLVRNHWVSSKRK